MSSVKGTEFFHQLNDYQLPKTLPQEISYKFLDWTVVSKKYQNTNNITATTNSLFKAERKLFHEYSYGRNFCMRISRT